MGNLVPYEDYEKEWSDSDGVYQLRSYKPKDKEGVKQILKLSPTLGGTYQDGIQWTNKCANCSPESFEENSVSELGSCLTCCGFYNFENERSFVLEKNQKVLFIISAKAYFPTLRGFCERYKKEISFYTRYPAPAQELKEDITSERLVELKRFKASLPTDVHNHFLTTCQAYYSREGKSPYVLQWGDWDRLFQFFETFSDSDQDEPSQPYCIDLLREANKNVIQKENQKLLDDTKISGSDLKGAHRKYHDLITGAEGKIWVRLDYYAHPDIAGKGWGTRLLRHLKDTLFQGSDIHGLLTTCATNNLASYRCLEKIGAKPLHTFDIERKDSTRGHPNGNFKEEYSVMFIAKQED